MLQTEKLNPAECANALRGLPAWVCLGRATEILRLVFEIPGNPDLDAHVKFIVEHGLPPVDLALTRQFRGYTNPSALTIIALFPSGAVRTIGNVTSIASGQATAALFDYLSLLDPDDTATDTQPGEKISGKLLILAAAIQ